jgi:hypothetical protein
MRLTFAGEEYEVRVQKRQVTYVDILQSGRHLSRGEAVLNPLDEDVANDSEGVRIAAERAIRALVPIKPILFGGRLRTLVTNHIVRKFVLNKLRPAAEALKGIERAINLRIGQIRSARRAERNRLRYNLVEGTGYASKILAPSTAEVYKYSPDFEGSAPEPKPNRRLPILFFGDEPGTLEALRPRPELGPGRLAPARSILDRFFRK